MLQIADLCLGYRNQLLLLLAGFVTSQQLTNGPNNKFNSAPLYLAKILSISISRLLFVCAIQGPQSITIVVLGAQIE